MQRLVASHADAGGFGMLGPDIEREGRKRAFFVTLISAFALFWLQTLPWLVATGRLATASSKADPPRVSPDAITSVRVSLLFDFLFLIALLFHVMRSSELVLMARRELARQPLKDNVKRGPLARFLDRHEFAIYVTGLIVLSLGMLADAVENVWLWAFASDDQAKHMSVPVLTIAVWVSLALGFAMLWVLAGWALRRMRSSSIPRPTSQPLAEPEGSIICCSGGGIRSASFCLGGLQVLSEQNIYADARAVVGVSGGGYIAAAMHILRWGKKFDLEVSPPIFAESSPEEAWLRRNTRFLLESIRVAALGFLSLLYGIVVNLFLVASIMIFAAWWLGWFYVASGGLEDWSTAHASAVQYDGAWRLLSLAGGLPLAAFVIFFVVDALDRLFKVPRWVRQGGRGSSVLLLAAGLVALVLCFGLPWLLVVAHNYAATSANPAALLIAAAGFVPHAVCDYRSSHDMSGCGNAGGTSVVGATAVSFAAIITAIATVLRAARRFLPDTARSTSADGRLQRLRERLMARVVPWIALVIIAIAAVTLLVRWTTALVADPHLLGHWRWFYIIGAGFLTLRLLTDANRTSLHYFYRERLSKAFVLKRLDSGGVQPVDYSEALRFSELRPPSGGGPELVACASANVSDNDIVPADRNCVPFTFGHSVIGLSGDLFPSEARTPSRLFEFDADQGYRVATIPAAMAISGAAISPLSGRFSRRLAPYRVVMALANARLGVWLPNPLWLEPGRMFCRMVTLRLEEDVEKYLQELGDAATADDLSLRRLKPRDLVWLRSLKLPTRTRRRVSAEIARQKKAVEERAATKRFARSWELPDRQSARDARRSHVAYAWLRRVLERPGAYRLVNEAIGKTSIYDRFLYVTDGGHYDNLGLVEALRRRPKDVYVLDASSDAENSFSTLGQAIATARMDLRCEVGMDPRPLQRGTKKPALVSYGTGSIRYEDGGEGTLHFVKAIVTAKLPWDVAAYAAQHTTFPRTPTANQLYGEFDLEAYRVLGREGTKALLGLPE